MGDSGTGLPEKPAKNNHPKKIRNGDVFSGKTLWSLIPPVKKKDSGSNPTTGDKTRLELLT